MKRCTLSGSTVCVPFQPLPPPPDLSGSVHGAAGHKRQLAHRWRETSERVAPSGHAGVDGKNVDSRVVGHLPPSC
jgi:hypothetical protein